MVAITFKNMHALFGGMTESVKDNQSTMNSTNPANLTVACKVPLNSVTTMRETIGFCKN